MIALFERQGEWQAASQLIGEQISSVGDDKRAELLARRARILAERLGDGPGAIADLDRALALCPNAPDLLQLVASLHESLQQWADAARAYEQLVKAAPDDNTRVHALVALSRIWIVEVPDYARAQRILEEAAKIDPHDRGITARLAEVTSLAGDTQRATELYQSLATHGLPVDRVEALLAYADLQKRMGQDSIDALAPAFDLAFDDFEVVRLLEGYYRLNDRLDRYLVHAEAAVNRARPGGRWNDTGPLRVSVGKIYARETSAPPNAVPFLEAAVEAAPDDNRLRVCLASAYARHNDPAAIRELRVAIERDPTDPLAFQRLVEACARTGRELVSALLATAVALLEGDDHRPPIVLPDPIPGALGPEDALAMFVGQSRARDVRRIAEHVDPYLGPLFNEKDKLDGAVQLPETYPVAGVVRQLAAALGARPMQLYWRDRAEVSVVALDPPVILLAGRHVKDDPSKIRFDLGYVIARIAGGSSIGSITSLDQITSMMFAIVDDQFDDPYGYTKRVSSALPRRARKDLEKMVPELSIDAQQVRLWDAEERRRALACGVIASCDLRSVARSLCPEALDAKFEERRARLRASPMMAEALRLATSDQCWAAIQRFYGRP